MDIYIRRLGNLLLNFLIILIVFLLALSIYAFYQTGVMKKTYFDVFGYTLFEVKTGSMADSIQIGDLVVVKVLNSNEKNELKSGDIISFIDNNYIITHRINFIDTNKIITKGDANNVVDTPIDKGAVIGKIIKTIPKIGIYKRVLLDRKVLLMICITASLFFVSFFVQEKTDNEYKKSNGNKDLIKDKKGEEKDNDTI